ncbi:hypothetical protein L1887_21016 [Cichorium endivia]|nr:hypothetical protein L1887_21016 [Cichorium endivia]
MQFENRRKRKNDNIEDTRMEAHGGARNGSHSHGKSAFHETSLTSFGYLWWIFVVLNSQGLCLYSWFWYRINNFICSNLNPIGFVEKLAFILIYEFAQSRYVHYLQLIDMSKSKWVSSKARFHRFLFCLLKLIKVLENRYQDGSTWWSSKSFAFLGNGKSGFHDTSLTSFPDLAIFGGELECFCNKMMTKLDFSGQSQFAEVHSMGLHEALIFSLVSMVRKTKMILR